MSDEMYIFPSKGPGMHSSCNPFASSPELRWSSRHQYLHKARRGDRHTSDIWSRPGYQHVESAYSGTAFLHPLITAKRALLRTAAFCAMAPYARASLARMMTPSARELPRAHLVAGCVQPPIMPPCSLLLLMMMGSNTFLILCPALCSASFAFLRRRWWLGSSPVATESPSSWSSS